MVPEHWRRLALHRARQAHARLGFVESFNGRFRDELLNETLFSSLTDARWQIKAWQEDYNVTARTRGSGLGNIPPAEFVAKNSLAIRAA